MSGEGFSIQFSPICHNLFSYYCNNLGHSIYKNMYTCICIIHLYANNEKKCPLKKYMNMSAFIIIKVSIKIFRILFLYSMHVLKSAFINAVVISLR